MTESDIAPGLTRDVYVALGEPLGTEGAWAVRVYLKPFVRCVWLGAVLMMLGGFCAAAERRLRPVRSPERAEDPGVHGGARMKFVRYLLPLVLFLGLSALLASGLGKDPRVLPSPLVGKPAPAFDLPTCAIRAARGQRDARGAAVPAQRLGHLVRDVPRGARHAAVALALEADPDRRPRLEGRPPVRPALAAAARRPVHRGRDRRRRPRSRSTSAYTARPNRSWSTARA
jgi:hypothetical protein